MFDRACTWLSACAAHRTTWWLTFFVACVLALAPLLLVDIPPLLDYPNHMARMFVLAFGQTDPVLSRMFAPHWSVIPNLALDVLIPPMLHVMPLDVAGRIAIAIAILLPIGGCVALSRAIFGVRSYWPIASAFAAHNVALRLGLLNFLFGVGLALLVAALWVAWRDTRPLRTIAITALGAVAVFFCHVMGLALLMLLLGCREAQVILAQKGGARVRFAEVLKRGGALICAFAAPLILFTASQVASTWTALLWQPLFAKVYGLFGGFLTVATSVDLAAAVVCFAFVYVCLREHRGRMSLWMAASGGILWIGYAAAPFFFKGSGFFSTRFPVMATFLLFAGFVPTALTPRARTITAIGFVALFCVRMAWIGTVWSDHNTDLAQLRQVIASVEPGSKVLVLCVPDDEAPAYWQHTPAGREIPLLFQTDLHEAALLLSEHKAFWPSMFASASQQPIVVLPPYADLSTPIVGPPPHSALSQPPNPLAASMFPIAPDWRSRFDYVLLLDAGGEPDLTAWAGDRMDLISATDAAALFRIRKPRTP
jgi:hypothetical protein